MKINRDISFEGVLAYTKLLSAQLDFDADLIEARMDEENYLKVFIEYFGDFIELV